MLLIQSVIIPNVIMLSIVMPSDVMLSIVMLSVVMPKCRYGCVIMTVSLSLSVVMAKCCYAEYRYAECRYTECRSAYWSSYSVSRHFSFSKMTISNLNDFFRPVIKVNEGNYD